MNTLSRHWLSLFELCPEATDKRPGFNYTLKGRDLMCYVYYNFAISVVKEMLDCVLNRFFHLTLIHLYLILVVDLSLSFTLFFSLSLS